MQFARRVRDGIRRGEITCAVRVWRQARVAVGQRFALAHGQIEVESVVPIAVADITPKIAKRAGFDSVGALVSQLRASQGRNVYLVAFRYLCVRAVGAVHSPNR